MSTKILALVHRNECPANVSVHKGCMAQFDCIVKSCDDDAASIFAIQPSADAQNGAPEDAREYYFPPEGEKELTGIQFDSRHADGSTFRITD